MSDPDTADERREASAASARHGRYPGALLLASMLACAPMVSEAGSTQCPLAPTSSTTVNSEGNSTYSIQWTSVEGAACTSLSTTSGTLSIASDGSGGASFDPAFLTWTGPGGTPHGATVRTGPNAGTIVFRVQCTVGCDSAASSIDYVFTNTASTELRDVATGMSSDGPPVSLNRSVGVPFQIEVESLVGGLPGGSGSVRFLTKSPGVTLDGNGSTVVVPLAANRAAVTVLAAQANTVFLSATWDPDSNPGTPNQATLSYFIEVADQLTATPDPSSTGGLFPDVGFPSFAVNLLVNGAPAGTKDGYCADWQVTRPGGGSPQLIPCVPFVGGRSNLSFADQSISIAGASGYGDWNVQAQVRPLILPGMQPQALRGPTFPVVQFPFGVAAFNLAFEPVSPGPVTGQPFTFPLRLVDQNGIGIPGFTVEFSTSQIATTPTSGTTAATQADGRTGAVLSDIGTPGVDGLRVDAFVTGFTDIDAFTQVPVSELTLRALDMAPGPSPLFTDFSSDTGVYAFTAVNTGTGDTPDPGVPVTFDILSGNATFDSGATSSSATSDSTGAAQSALIRVQRTPGPVQIRASAPGRTPFVFSLPVSGSTYQVVPVSPISGTMAYGEQLDLQAALTAQKPPLSPVPLADAGMTWQVTGPAGASVVSPALTDGSGVSTTVFSPGAAGMHTITASFDPSPAISSPPAPVIYQIDVTAAYVMTPVTPPSGTATIPTFTAQPLRIFLDFGGTPAAGEPVEWLIISSDSPGGPSDGSLSAPSTITDASGNTQVNFQASAPGNYVIRATQPIGGPTPESFDFQITVSSAVQSLSQVSGDEQQGVIGQALAQPLVVIARDNSLPADGVGIDWLVTPSGAATVAPNPSTTSGGGLSSVNVTLSQAANPGVVTVVARRQDAPLSSASFIINAVADTPIESLEIVSGNNQRGLVGTPAQPLQVRYLVGGVPQAGALVGWNASGPVVPSNGTSTTNASGVATFNVAFGNTPGFAVVTATSGQANVRFDLEAAGPELAILSGDGQSGAPGSVLEPFVVQVSTPTTPASPLQGQRVTWTVDSGGGSLSVGESITGADGRASSVLTLGTIPGVNTVRAQLDSGESVLFEASSATPALVLFSGDGQRGPIETQGDLALVVSLTDEQGRPRENEIISWEVISGDAQLLSETGAGPVAESLTGSNGRAQIRFRHGGTPGLSIVQAGHPSAARPVRFTLEAQLPSLSIVSGNNQTGTAGTELADDLVVRIAPSASKALTGVTVYWEVVDGGGALQSATSSTDADGVARNRLTLGSAAGQQRVSARVNGVAPVTFIATSVAGAIQLIKVSGDNQNGLTPNLDSAPLVLRVVREAGGAVVSNAQIRWSASNARFVAADGSLVNEIDGFTNAQGEARVIARVIQSGPASVTARGQGFASNEVAFTLQGALANIGGLSEPEEGIAGALDRACPAVAALATRTPAQEDLLLRCRELQDGAGPRPEEVRDALDEMIPDIGITLADAGRDILVNQIGNVTNYLLTARRNPQGGGSMNVSLATATGALPLSFLPSAVLQATGDESDTGAEGQDLGPGFSRLGFFATGQIGRARYRDGDRTPDYDYDAGHLTAGVDYRFSDNVIAGLALGVSRGTTELRRGDGELDSSSWSLLGYGTWYNAAQWYLDGSVTWGSVDYELTRRVAYTLTAPSGSQTRVDQLADASTDGDQLGLSLSVGRDFQKGAWSLSTYLRGAYLRSDFDGYVERMVGPGPGAGLALAVEARELTSLDATLGGRATYVMSRDWGILMPQAIFEFQHRFEDDPARVVASFAADPGGSTFLQTGDEIDSNVMNLGFGLSALWPGGRSAFVQYERLVSASRLRQDTLSLGLRFEF